MHRKRAVGVVRDVCSRRECTLRAEPTFCVISRTPARAWTNCTRSLELNYLIATTTVASDRTLCYEGDM